jgi:hypothetical protein
VSKTLIDLFHSWLNTQPPSPELCYGCACKGFEAGYKTAHNALYDQIQFLEAQLRQANGMVMRLEAEK